jgi:FMN phosphatase YigB (HAD superfamily)
MARIACSSSLFLEGFASMAIKVVFFDVGETLFSEERMWAQWAGYLGVAEDVFRGALQETIARGEHHRRVFDAFRSGFDIEAARLERAARGDRDVLQASDLYPDAVPCLKRLRRLGYLVGIAGNQSAEWEAALRQLGLGVDLIASSASLGAEKPSQQFFEGLVRLANVCAAEIAYVGDRLDNDVLPARVAGMLAVFAKRGPWGRAHAEWPQVALAHLRVQSLEELPDALTGYVSRGSRSSK